VYSNAGHPVQAMDTRSRDLSELFSCDRTNARRPAGIVGGAERFFHHEALFHAGDDECWVRIPPA